MTYKQYKIYTMAYKAGINNLANSLTVYGSIEEVITKMVDLSNDLEKLKQNYPEYEI